MVAKRLLRLLPPCAAVALLAGCRTNKDILNDYERDLLAGNYEHAMVEVSEKAQDDGVDQLMWRLHAASANRLAGHGDQAIEYLDLAEDIFLRNDGTSVFSQSVSGTFAMLTNDRAFPFAGGGQDRVFTCLYKAIDYAAAGRVDAARTELNRAAQHQDNWLYARRRDIEAARDELKEQSREYAKENKSAEAKESSASSVDRAFANAEFAATIREKTGFDPAVDGKLEMLSQKDYLNAYAQHVCGVFRWLTDGDGRDYLNGLKSICAGNAMVARDCADAERRVRPSDQVWIYVEDGLGPCREEWRLDLPLILIPYANRYIMYAGMAVPYLRYRSSAARSYVVEAAGAAVPLEVLQDMDRLMKVEHDVYFRGALAREIVRVIVKAGTQVALGIACDSCGNDYAKIAIRASQLSAAAYAASVTQADLRSWTALPKAVLAARVARPANGRIVLKGDGAVVADITVPAGNSMVFVTKPGAGAKASVRVATF